MTRVVLLIVLLKNVVHLQRTLTLTLNETIHILISEKYEKRDIKQTVIKHDVLLTCTSQIIHFVSPHPHVICTWDISSVAELP